MNRTIGSTKGWIITTNKTYFKNLLWCTRLIFTVTTEPDDDSLPTIKNAHHSIKLWICLRLQQMASKWPVSHRTKPISILNKERCIWCVDIDHVYGAPICKRLDKSDCVMPSITQSYTSHNVTYIVYKNYLQLDICILWNLPKVRYTNMCVRLPWGSPWCNITTSHSTK